MTTHGRVDCYINPVDVNVGNREQEMWANCVQFLTGALAQSLGIRLIASNYGTSGKGLGFWDDQVSGAGGSNKTAWAVFRWTQAPKGQFDCLLYIASGSGTTLSPFNISGGTVVYKEPYSYGMFGMAFACHPSSSTTHPWNGSTNANGADTLGTPIWQTGSLPGLGAFFPRANSTGGAFATNRNFLAICHDDAPALPIRFHILLTEGSFTMFEDVSLNNSYRMFHFGSYTPRVGSTPTPDSPYVMIWGRGPGNTYDPINFYNTLSYGSLAGGNFGAGYTDGGISHPNLLSGSKTMSLITVGNNNLDINIGAFNPFVNNGAYELLPIYVCINEGGDNAILGQLDYLNCSFGVTTSAVNAVSGTCAFGRNVSATLKILAPWSGSSPGSLTGVRTGREF